MHLVVPLGPYSKDNQDLELRYMLRSAWKNCRDLWRVVIVGHCPSWLKIGNGLEHLPCDDTNTREKDANIIRKILLASKELGEDFIVNSDDQIFCQQVDASALWNAWLDPIDLAWAERRRKQSLWHDRMLRTRDECRRRQWPDWVFEVHIPYPVDHEWYQRLMQEMAVEHRNGFLTHIYLNGYIAEGFPRRLNPPGERPPDLLQKLKRSRTTYEDARTALATHRFVNFNDAGFTVGTKQALAEKFPEPSPWES